MILAKTWGVVAQLSELGEPDVVVISVDSRSTNLSQVLKAYNEAAGTSGVPLIVLSDDPESGEWRQTKNAGAFPYLAKPLDIPYFLDLARQALGKDGQSGREHNRLLA